MNPEEVSQLVKLLEEKNAKLLERERELQDRSEELMAQKEELTAAIEEVMGKNESLNSTLGKLKERNFELDQILYRTSHDLRSPVTSMKGIMMLMKAELQTPACQEYAKHLNTRLQQMDGLLDSLTTLARVMSDPIQFTTFSVKELIGEAFGLASQRSGLLKTELRMHIASDVATHDRYLLLTLLKELLENAGMFGPETGSLVDVIWDTVATEWYLEVKDNGEGIPPEVQPKIFEMFYRGSENSQGNGLGLYIARKVLDRLGGRVDFVSKPGETRFMFYLPHHQMQEN